MANDEPLVPAGPTTGESRSFIPEDVSAYEKSFDLNKREFKASLEHTFFPNDTGLMLMGNDPISLLRKSIEDQGLNVPDENYDSAADTRFDFLPEHMQALRGEAVNYVSGTVVLRMAEKRIQKDRFVQESGFYGTLGQIIGYGLSDAPFAAAKGLSMLLGFPAYTAGTEYIKNQARPEMTFEESAANVAGGVIAGVGGFVLTRGAVSLRTGPNKAGAQKFGRDFDKEVESLRTGKDPSAAQNGRVESLAGENGTYDDYIKTFGETKEGAFLDFTRKFTDEFPDRLVEERLGPLFKPILDLNNELEASYVRASSSTLGNWKLRMLAEIDTLQAGVKELGHELPIQAVNKLKGRVSDIAEFVIPTPKTFEQMVDSFGVSMDRSSLKSVIGKMELAGHVTTATSKSIQVAIDVMPENFLKKLTAGAARGTEGQRSAAFYSFLEDSVGLYGARLKGLETAGVPVSAGQVFAHEVGHRVFFTMATEKELILARKLFDDFQRSSKSAEFLKNYKDKSLHFSEFFAEEFAEYWNRVATTGRESAFTWLEGAHAANALGMANLFQEMASRIINQIRRMAGHADVISTEAELLDSFFKGISKRIGNVKAEKIISDLDEVGFSRSIRFKDGDDLLRPIGPDDFTPNLKGYSEAVIDPAYIKNFDEAAQGDASMLPAWMLEKLPDSPVKRMLQSTSPFTRHIASYLVEHPFYQKMNERGIVTPHGVDRNIAVEWIAPMGDAMKASDDLYTKYRTRIANEATEAERGATGYDSTLRQMGADLVQGRGNALSKTEFMEEIGKAKRRLDRPYLASEIPEAAEAAKVWQEKVFGRAGVEAQKAQVFSIRERRRLKTVQGRMDELLKGTRERGMTVKQLKYYDDLVDQVKNLEKEIELADNFALDANYLTRLWNTGKITAKRSEFEALLIKEGGYSHAEAQAKVDSILSGKAFVPIDDELTGMARSIKEREIVVDDILFEDYLENNIAALGRYYSTRMGADVELTKQFGSIDLKEVITAIKDDYAGRLSKVSRKSYDDLLAFEEAKNSLDNFDKLSLVEPVSSNKAFAKLLKERNDSVESLLVIRDRIRGTYGIPDDPASWTNRGIRVAKMWNAVSLLTGGLSQVADLGKLVYADNFKTTLKIASETLQGDLKGTMKLAKREANLAGEALDMYLAMRSALFADLSDSLSAATPFERAAGNATQQFFNIALMNQWNEGVKTLASLISGTRLIVESGNLATGKITKLERTKLVNLGIDEKSAKIIWDQSLKHGMIGEKGHVRIAKTELWDGAPEVQAARKLYTSALGKDINRIIVTPGKGETPAFMSKPLASLIFQFKTFGIAATHRTLTPGLQLKDKNFLTGNIALFALGAMIDQTRRWQMDMNNDQSFGDFVVSAIERGGNVGIITDMNQILETLTDDNIGIRPLLGGGRPYGSSDLAKLGALGGPIVQQSANLGRVLWDIGPGDADSRTMDAARRLSYMGKLFYVDGLFDKLEDGATALVE